MKILVLPLAFLCIGLFLRDFDRKAKLLVFLIAACVVVYVTLK